jgi:hypothetical protein
MERLEEKGQSASGESRAPGEEATMHPRMRRERETVATMIGLYCRGNHHTAPGELCAECRQLLDYALLRLRHCPFQEGKTTCGNCAIHCYKPAMREKIREVMGFSGPRMLWAHPLLGIAHLIDGLRKEPLQRR